MSQITELQDLPSDVKRRVNALRNIQDKHSALEAQFREEVLALEKKYLTKHQPLFDQRAKIVAGDIEPSDAEAKREPDEDEDEDAVDVSKPVDKPTKGIPEFWLTALKTNAEIGELITEKDEEALKALKNIKYSYLPDNPGFKLEFFFSENDFFTNKKLEKTYYLINSPDASYGDVVYDRAEGTKIDWKEDKDLSVTVEIKTQRHKTTNKTRTVKKTVPAPTFFSFFNPPKPPSEDDDEEDIDEDIDQKLEMDYEIGETIKEKIIPHAVDWFTGKALQYEDNEDYDEFDEDEDFDGEEGEDDDDEEGGAPGAEGEKPAECKQQ
ncbi:nucleosome assembly protein [Rhizoclosmatium globosum]|uniref:Nucleosome assembly protein n=1 Tax=Rhizoclosmatium globosum TaxID=329046 RepID=A0A1Y2CZE7_9FUNG|nr:hypothetical protein HDU79_003656 [Rhizoclosmatium sp. JEL0117]ORY52399.1 nucleosome assembly protein [Rhizoclosmatium globosum]|eukprot:ORY52399.1 nucleosome assembly protein [Rhizoclosmatium globosum]